MNRIVSMNQVEEKLRYPMPGSRAFEAPAHGVDLTLLIERLRLSPEERVLDLQRAIRGLEGIHRKANRIRARGLARQDATTKKERS